MKRLNPATRLFDVECVCGGEFRVALDVATTEPRAGGGFLATPSGRCPHCGLELDEIEPFADRPTPPAGRSRA